MVQTQHLGQIFSSAFKSLLLGLDYQGPGINKRQVWGRMATQLFAKSALAESWGGKTFWLVQDQLLKPTFRCFESQKIIKTRML